MNIQGLSKVYKVSIIKESDVSAVYELCLGNPQYYEYCPPAVSMESIRADMQALPPGKTEKDKYYIGFWSGEKLVAVMDLILEYPDKKTAFIGFFMMDAAMQYKGIGSDIIEGVCRYLTKKFSYVRLGYVKGNMQSEHFWIKNKFKPTGTVTQTKDYEVVVMQRALQGMKAASKIALAFFIPVCTAILILGGMVFMPLVKYAFKLYPSQAYRKIEDAGQIVFWDRDYLNSKSIPYRRGFWGLKSIHGSMEKVTENNDEYDYSVYDVSESGRQVAYYDNAHSEICLYDTETDDEKCVEKVNNSVEQIVFSPNEKYILYKEIEYGGEMTDDEYCYYKIINIENQETVTIYQGYREWYDLQW